MSDIEAAAREAMLREALTHIRDMKPSEEIEELTRAALTPSAPADK